MNQSIAVLGLGRYGTNLAKSLYDMGADVLVVDRNRERIEDMEGHCTSAVCADLSEEDELLSLGLENMDIVVTAMGRNLAASIMAVAVAKEKGVPLIVAKSSSERMSLILKKVGADKAIIPEEDAGTRSARILASKAVLDYFEVGDKLAMVEMKPLPQWVGKSLVNLNLRKYHQLNIVAVKRVNDEWALVDPKRPMDADSKLLVVLESSEINRLK